MQFFCVISNFLPYLCCLNNDSNEKIILSFIFAAGIYSSSMAQIKMPQPSSTQTIKQDFGMGNIELTYSRPNAKGRKILVTLYPLIKFGEQVPMPLPDYILTMQ
jgi:hypothetical protein